MVAEKDHDQSVANILECKSISESSAAFKNARPQLPNPDPAVDVRVPKRSSELKQCEHRADSFGLGKCAQSFLHGGA